MKKSVISGAAAVAIMAATPAFAADTFYTQEKIASAIDIAFGLTATTAYVSRGFDYSNGPAIQGYVEASYDWAYVGVWASSIGGPIIIDDNPNDRAEINVYGGIRPTFGDLSLDIGYARYFYNSTGDLGGEIYGKAEYEFSDLGFTPGFELYWKPQNGGTYGLAKASLALPYDFSLSGGVGTTFAGNVDWNAGLSYTFNDLVTIDGRYYGSNRNETNMFGHKFVASISFDTSWSALSGY